MSKDTSYSAIMARKGAILKRSTGIDYESFERSPLAFDYEGLMHSCPYVLQDVQRILSETGVGQTPLVELKNMTALVRSISPPGPYSFNRATSPCHSGLPEKR